MSIVERALTKMQKERPPRRPRPLPVHPTDVVDDDQGAFAGIARRLINLNREQLVQRGLLAPREHTQAIEEQFRGIKRPLLKNAFARTGEDEIANGNLLMIASAVTGEGKTFASFNLALSVAQERDHPVVLIDADVRKPDITASLGLTLQKGFLDLIESDDVELSDVLLATDCKGLFVLPCGEPRPNSAELLASRKMANLVNGLAATYRSSMFIFDSSPLLQTNESRVLTGLAGQVALVVAAERTMQSLVLDAVALVEEDKPLNLILNRSLTGGSSYYYDYGST